MGKRREGMVGCVGFGGSEKRVEERVEGFGFRGESSKRHFGNLKRV